MSALRTIAIAMAAMLCVAWQNATRLPSLTLAARVDHVDALAREPMVVEHPDGTLFVSGYGDPGPKLWKSGDHGATWSRVNVGSEADGAIGNSDVDLAVARDGTLYFITMGFNRKTGEGTHIAMGVSRDVGVTWRWTMLAKDRFDDRPWVAVASDGTAHAIWNDGSGVSHAVSHDRGITWTQGPRINEKGGSSHIALGPHQEIAVRIVPLSASGNKFDGGIDLIAVSTDGGATWKKRPAPGERQWTASLADFPIRWVEPLAWDSRGRLYAFWTDPVGLVLSRSIDQGETWTTWRVAKSDEMAYFPYLIARGPGELAATWYTGRGETLKAHVGRFDVRDGDAAPRLIEAPAFQTDSWRGNPLVRETAGEYFGITFLRAGGIGVVTTIQNKGETKASGFTWWRFSSAAMP